jgi:hypothetical protein
MNKRKEGTVTLSSEAWVALLLGLLGFLGTTGMLVMNLSIRSEMRAGDLKIERAVNSEADKLSNAINLARSEAAKDNAELKVELANMRTKVAEGQVSMYQQIMDNMSRTYMNREASQSMHEANSKRLDGIDQRLTGIEERLPT